MPVSTADSATATPKLADLRLLWSFVAPHGRVLAVGTVLGLGATAVGLATPLAVKRVLDTVGAGAGAPLRDAVVILVGLFVLGAVTSMIQWILLGRLAERIVLDVRGSLIRRFVRGTVADVQRYAPGELVTRVTSDTVLLREAAGSSLVQIVNGSVALVGTVALMAVLDVPLLLTSLVAVAAVAVVMAILMPRIGAAERLAQESLGRLGAALEGSVRAVRTVKVSGAEERQITRVTAEAEAAMHHSVRAVRTTAVVWTVAGGGMQVATIAILGLGAWRVSEGALAVSTLVAFLLYVFQLMDPISTLTGAAQQVQSGIAAAARVREVEAVREEDLHERGDAAAGSAAGPAAGGRRDGPFITLEGVTVRYPGAQADAVRELDVVVPRRGHTAIVGPSGAGKTTTFSLLLRFLDPDAGTIRLDGVPYHDLGLAAVRGRIAYVEQETPLVHGTLRENLLFRYPEAGEDDVWRALRAVRLDEVIHRLPQGLDTPALATNLSGGERQRVALARAVVRRPDLLLLDEATAQLDGLTEAAVQDVIADVAAHGAVVTIAHRLSTVVDADQILLMEEGRLRSVGTHEQLLSTDALYRELVVALRIATDPASTRPTVRPTVRPTG